eukprot:SM000008S22263  [mRNA]  locus=s8:698531:706797:+ [translate_table: standard]
MTEEREHSHDEGGFYGWHPQKSDKSCAHQDEKRSTIIKDNGISVVARGIKQGQEAHETPGPTSWLRVNVPVLSLHNMSMPAISSMAVMRLTIAPCLCRCRLGVSACWSYPFIKQSVSSRASISNVSSIAGTCLARWWEPMAMVTDRTVGMAIGMPPIKSTRRLLMPFLYLRFCMANITIASMRMPMKMDTMQKLPIIASTCRPKIPSRSAAFTGALDKFTTGHRPSGSDPAGPLYPPGLPACMLTLSKLHPLPSCSLAMTRLSAPTAQPSITEPRICRDDVAAPDANEISRHKVRCLHLFPGSVTEDLLTKPLRACLELIPDLVHGGMLLFEIHSAAQTLEVRRRSAHIDQQAFGGPHFLHARLVLRGQTTGIEPISGRLYKGQPLKPLSISVRVTAARPLLVMADCSSHSQGRIRWLPGRIAVSVE